MNVTLLIDEYIDRRVLHFVSMVTITGNGKLIWQYRSRTLD